MSSLAYASPHAEKINSQFATHDPPRPVGVYSSALLEQGGYRLRVTEEDYALSEGVDMTNIPYVCSKHDFVVKKDVNIP